MTRIELIREYIERAGVGNDREGDMEKLSCLVHLYGVSQFCALIAMKRGLNVELAIIAGMLHDIHTLIVGSSEKHAHRGAELAREILSEAGVFEPEEIDIIAAAVYNHSAKRRRHEPFCEALIDADVMQHYFYDPGRETADKERERLEALKLEFLFA